MKTHVCPWWLAYFFDHPGRKLVHQPERIFGGYLKPGMSALDFGCGMGYFSIGMARILGEDGRVIAVDLQPQMLDVLRRRAESAGVGDRVTTHQCAEGALNLAATVDFALSFWVMHEVPDRDRALREIRECLAPGGRFLLVEPAFHVSPYLYHEILESAHAAGFQIYEEPRVRLSRAALLGAMD
jgi:ubiquinone/menaquinone biosynthesis C-methylase UbiE